MHLPRKTPGILAPEAKPGGGSLGFPLGGGGQGLRQALGFPPLGALPPKPGGAAALGGASPPCAIGEGPGGGAQPYEGCCVPLCGPLGPKLLPGPRNPFRSSADFPILPGTLPDSETFHPIYQSSSPDHSGDPRHVRDLIRDSEQPSVTMHCSH